MVHKITHRQPRPVARKVTMRVGPCDRGDRELIRRRLLNALGALAAELQRSPKAVLEMAREIAAVNFEES
jgi:hypothetical protein